MASDQIITLEYRGKIAIITLNDAKKLNALNGDRYYRIAELLREIEKRDDIYITLFTGKGRFFSAGADVSMQTGVQGDDVRRHWLRSFVANNLDVTRAFYTHPKILITALNGPVVGLTAALIAFSDFIYAMPHAFLLTPFTSLGLVAEGGASHAFVQRMGRKLANEALIMSKRITAEELLQAGFLNKIFDTDNDDARFREEVMKEIHERLGDHLNNDSLLMVKALIRKPELDTLEKQNVAEVFGGLQRFAAGLPQEEFRKISSGEKRHKL
ncbi:MAG: hypothetical protein M1832_003080 [Thelocarpon impressellum]|nr:MAG: hypothetical protein M1832_003080 [Thelocarpon impressellum]